MENKYLQNEEALLAYAAKAITLMQLDKWASDSALEAEIVRSPESEKRMKCLFAPVYAVQQAVISTVISWYEKFVSFSFVSDSPYVVSLPDDFSVGYWPEGYDEVVDDEKNRFMFSEARANANGDVTSIYAKVIETLLDANLDNENAKISTNFSFNGQNANLSVSEDGMTHLLWYDGNILLEVSSKENLNEIVKIAESIIY